MYSVASRIAVAGFVVYALGAGCRTFGANQEEPQPEQSPPLREMARASSIQQEPQPEQLPPAKELPPEIIVWESYLFRPCTRTNRYDVWQFYAVARHGRFRPVVAYSPYGSYYLYGGQSYPWITTHQLDFMPYVVGN